MKKIFYTLVFMIFSLVANASETEGMNWKEKIKYNVETLNKNIEFIKMWGI